MRLSVRFPCAVGVLLTLACTDLGSQTNTGPSAQASATMNVPAGREVELDGSASTDEDEDGLTHRWSFESVPDDSDLVDEDITDADEDVAVFVPDVLGEYLLALTVSDGELEDTDTVRVVAGRPIANAGQNQSVPSFREATLDGTKSELFGGGTDGLVYEWTFASVPDGSSIDDSDIDEDTATPTFAPDVPGAYGINLVVFDGASLSDPDFVVVDVDNEAPIADPGEDRLVKTGAVATLDGSGSSDPDGHPLEYAWELTSFPISSALRTADIEGRDTATPQLTPDLDGIYTLSLVVTDGYANSAAVEVELHAGVPQAVPGRYQLTEVSQPITLDGSQSTGIEGAVSYAWSFESVPDGSALTNADLQDRTGAEPTFTPDVPGDYVLALVVADQDIESPAALTTVPVSALVQDLTFPDANLQACVLAREERFAREVTDLQCGQDRVEDFTNIAALSELVELTVYATAPVDLSPLSGLTKLELLRTGSTVIEDLSPLTSLTNLKTLDLGHTDLPDIAPLGDITSLEKLTLPSTGLTDISPLASLTNLVELALYENAITDVTPLAPLGALVKLRLNDNPLADLTGLGNHPNLEVLDLRNDAIVDVTPLTGLPSLKTLELTNNSVVSTAGLSTLTALDVLNLEDNQVSDLSGIATMTELTELRLSSNQVVSVAPLATATSLKILDLSVNSVVDVSGLSTLNDVVTLNLRSNDVVDVSPLGNLQSLQVLELTSNRVVNANPLGSLPEIRQLHLASNLIVKPSGLTGMPTLTMLFLGSNLINDVSGLGANPSLRHLSLAGNLITDLSPLSGAQSLQTLIASNNSLSTVAGLQNVDALTYLDVSSNSISDVSSIATLTSLESLFITESGVTTGVADLVTLVNARGIVLSYNYDIPCADLDVLSAALPGVVTAPSSCAP